jgi:hypothetical protein
MRKAGIVLAALALLVLGGVAYAAIPDSGGVIHGCYKTSDGKLRVIDSASESCVSGETALNWSQTGPAGATGATGAAGANGVSGREVVNASEFLTPGPLRPDGFRYAAVRAECSEGKVPTGGGGHAQLTSSGNVIHGLAASEPGGTYWQVIFALPGDAAYGDYSGFVQVICVTAS